MTNVSKKQLDKKLATEIWEQLQEAVGRLSVAQAGQFLSGLLTTSEQIMLAKRLAAIVLIHERHTSYAIANTLQMSTATIGKLQVSYERGAFLAVVDGISKNRHDYLEFVETLLDIIHLGLPRYAGPKRFKK